MLLALCLRIAFARINDLPGDISWCYGPQILDILSGQWQSDTWVMRLGVILPASALTKLTGSFVMGGLLTALFFSMLQVYCVYRIGKILWNAKVGLLAATFEAVYPLSIHYATQAIPDVVMSSCITAAMMFYFQAVDGKNSMNPILCGVFVALGYTAKLPALFIIPILGCLVVIHRNRLHRGAMVTFFLGVLGFLLVLGMETLGLSLIRGTFTFRPYEMLHRSGAALVRLRSLGLTEARFWPGFFEFLFIPMGREFIFNGLYGYILLLLTVWMLLQRTWKQSGVVSIWLWGLLLVTNYACLGPDCPIVPVLYARYLEYLTPPICLFLAHEICGMSRLWKRLCVVCVIVTSLGAATMVFSTFRPHNTAFGEFSKTLACPSGRPTWVHSPNMASHMNLMLGRPDACLAVDGERLRQGRPGQRAVLFNIYYIDSELPEGYAEQLGSDNWKLVDSWSSHPTFLETLFRRAGVPTKKGWDVSYEIYEKQ